MSPALAQRMAARAGTFTSLAVFTAACALVAARHGLDPGRVRAGLSRSEQTAVAHAARGLVETDAATYAQARREAIYLAVTVFGRPHKSVARALGVTPKAVRKALTAIEERREDGRYDRALDDLELELMGAA